MLPWILAFALSSAPMQESDPAALLPPTAQPDYSAEVKMEFRLNSLRSSRI